MAQLPGIIEQIMELYIDSRICSRWVTLNPDEKIKFFKNFSREKKLSELLFFGFDYFSKSEFKLYPDLLKENLTALFEECITDFSNAFKETVKASRVVKDSEPGFEKEDFLDSALSFYLFQGTGLLSESFHQIPANMIQSFKTIP